MIVLSAIIFVITLLIGLYLLSYVVTEKNTPKGIAILHGTLGALGIIALIIGTYFYPRLIYSLFLFLLAAIGGFALILLDLLGKKIPKILAIGHGLIAISGFIVLCFGFIN